MNNTDTINIKIAIIIGDISLGNGTERAVTNLANSLCTLGNYEIHIVSCCSSEYSKPYFCLNKNIIIHHLSIPLVPKKNYFVLKKRIKYLCKIHNIKFVLGTTHSLNSLLIGIKRDGLIRIACEHMPYAAAPFYSRIVRRLVYPKLDAVVLLTENDRNNYTFCKNTYVIPNSVPQLEESAACENKLLLGVGRYTKQKGFDMLIKAFSLVHQQIPDWKLKIIGQGEDKALLENLIRENTLQDKVELAPPTKNIKDEYLQAGIFVLSSRFEGFVLVLTEAKSVGLPTISFNCPEGPADIVQDGRDGYLVEPENIVEFGDRIVQLAKDENLRKSFGKTAKEDIKRLSPEHIYSQWNNLFNSFLH